MSEGCGGSFANGRLGQGSSPNRSIAPPQPQATSFISGRCVPARTCAGIGLSSPVAAERMRGGGVGGGGLAGGAGKVAAPARPAPGRGSARARVFASSRGT
eukprot:scaffold14711_cov87-Isochrysis_galbana.AAC.1